MRFLYTLALYLLFPYVFTRLLWRARKQPEYLHHVGERFGFYSAKSDKPVIWIHTVSVGETRAAQSIIVKLRTNYPGHQILLTHTTPTGRASSNEMYGDSILRVYLPYDYPFAIRRFFKHFRPSLGVLMETEIWFNLIHECHHINTPLFLLNARMSEKSAKSYARFAKLTSNALTNLTAIAAQTPDDADRLTRLGATNVSVMGNLKYDINPPSNSLGLGKRFREQFGATRKIILAASTREGEEALILDALQPLHFLDALLVIVPRHPQRFSDIQRLLEQRNINYLRRSDNQPASSDVQVVLGDSMGELFAYYACADLAFIGGSLLPFGGQNLIESCAVGTPVIIGPNTYNFAEATRLAVKAGAAIQIKNIESLIVQLRNLLNNPTAISVMHQRCLNFVKGNQGATEKAMQIITTSLKKTITSN